MKRFINNLYKVFICFLEVLDHFVRAFIRNGWA